jgi:hypothetical protein
MSAATPISKIRPQGGQRSGLALSDVFSPDGELLWSFYAHFDPPTRSAKQRDLDWAVGKQLRHGHIGVDAIRGLYDDRFIGSTAEY